MNVIKLEQEVNALRERHGEPSRYASLIQADPRPSLAESFPEVSQDELVPLEAVLCTEALAQRPARAPDYKAESDALAVLVQALADSPRTILQTLADTILALLRVGSAGVSLLTKDDQAFVWPAVAGAWLPYIGGRTPRDFGPCGDVLDCNAPLLFRRPERRYAYFVQATPLVEECLLVPFYVKGKAVGTIWAIAHDERRVFDGEDLRQLQALGRFASAAYQAGEELDTARTLMEDALQSRQAIETLNVDLRRSEERYRMLFESLDEGFCIIEKVEAIAGEPLDFRFVEANPAFAVQSGISEVVGKTLRQLFKDESSEWIETYDAVCSSGKPIRFEREFVGQGRVLELYAFRVEGISQQRVAINFQDITQRKRAERLLQQNRDTFFNLVENAPFGLYIVDAQFCLRHVSTASQKVFSNVHPLIGRDFDEVLRLVWPDPFVSEGLAHFRHTLKTGEPYSAPNTTQQRQDIADIESYDWKIERIVLPDGQFGVVCYFYDITERIQAEQALRESEERYRNLFNSMDEGFCIIEMMFDENDKPVDYRFLEVNPAFEKQTGRHGMMGKRVRETIPDLEDRWFEIYGQVALTGEPVRFIDEVKALDSWLDVHAARLGGPGTRQVAVLFDNITERKKAEEALRESESRFRILFDSGPTAIYSCDAAGMIQEYNACAVKLWGQEPKPGDSYEQFRSTLRFFLPDGSLEPDRPSILASVLDGTVATVMDREITFERPDSSRITVLTNMVPLKNEQGRISGAMCSFYDITERSRLQRDTLAQAQALADVDRRKDEFLAMLSHELRNPLAAMSNAMQLLRLQKKEAPLQQQARQVLERQLGQLRHLVDDLLEVSRITSGRVQLRLERVSVGGIAERAVETVQPLIAQRRHTLKVSLPPEPIFLQADAARIEQVVVNLLTNAAKYTDEGGRIWLSVEYEDAAAMKADGPVALPMVVISVRDTGIGIAPELLPHVFDLFTQAERTIDRSQGGLGIGLCLVQRLVELHGGSVAAHSAAGQGSEFVVRLPLLPLPPTGLRMPLAPAVDAAQPQESPPQGCRVLVVDDNVDAAQCLAILLELAGHEVQIGNDGPSALAAALAYRPDAVLLDIGLPGLTGYQVAQRMRGEATLRHTVLVALTGYGQETDRQISQQAGFDHHLVKPADFADVQKILAGVAQKKG